MANICCLYALTHYYQEVYALSPWAPKAQFVNEVSCSRSHNNREDFRETDRIWRWGCIFPG